MATIYRSTLPEVFEARQAELLFKGYTMQPTTYTKVFNVESSNKAYEDWFEVTGLGVFKLKPEGTPISYETPVQGTRRRIVHSTFASGYTATHEAIADEQYALLDKYPADLGEAAREHDEIIAWAMFNSATDANLYPTGDGLALASTAHTIYKPKDPAAATYSNLASPGVALSTTGLEAALTSMLLTKSREDRFIPLEPAFLVINPTLAHLAHQLLNTDKEAFTNENQVSTVATSRTGIQPVSTPYVTDTDNWALVCKKSQHKLCFYVRQKLTFDSSTDAQTKNKLFDAMKRNSVVAKDWRGTYWSRP